MDNSRHYKIALVLYTQGLDYDDRIRKEILSIQKFYPNVKFKIFAVEPQNREDEGMTSYGVPYRIPFLKTRDKYASASHTLAKALDFYNTVKDELKAFDALWCADIETFPFVLLSKMKLIVWDHHELPLAFVNKCYMRWLYKRMERKCKVMIHANQPRLEYMDEKGLVSDRNKHFVLRNYPDFNEIDNEYDDTYNQFEKWLGDEKCVYLQGLTGPARADVESIGAVLAVPGLKAVVLGRVSEDQMRVFEQRFGKELLSERIYFVGQQKQLKTPQYIRKCIMSLVFYKKTSMNNWYCEPNRLFQNIINGNPVVVGNNPPMKELVDNYGVGVCVDTDGSDQEKIVAGIKDVLENMDSIKTKLAAAESQWLWGSQENTIRKIVDKLF